MAVNNQRYALTAWIELVVVRATLSQMSSSSVLESLSASSQGSGTSPQDMAYTVDATPVTKMNSIQRPVEIMVCRRNVISDCLSVNQFDKV